MIDYEYAGWNPMTMDIANYVNETALDNSYPGQNGIWLYTDNFMSESEIEYLAKRYMKYYFEKYAHSKVKERYQNNT